MDSILVEAAPRPSAAQVRRNLAAALPQAKVQTAAKQDRYTLDGLKGFISIIKGVLLGFGGVALLVGAFTIFNSLSIMVAQRSREFGLLRLAGASRRQVLRTVVAEALAMGAAASAAASKALISGLTSPAVLGSYSPGKARSRTRSRSPRCRSAPPNPVRHRAQRHLEQAGRPVQIAHACNRSPPGWASSMPHSSSCADSVADWM